MGRDRLVDRKTASEWIIREWGEKAWSVCIWFRTGTSEHSIGLWGSIKGRENFDQLSDF
jgi:hypothetical protein